MSQEDVHILKRALAREKAARKAAEKILEEKSAELYNLTQELQASNEQLEKLVREKTTELRGVFENIVDAYVVMDLWGNVLKMNDAAVTLLGYDKAYEDFNLLELADSSEADHVMNGFQMLMNDGALTNFQVKINTKDNLQRLVHINASIILDENNNPIAAQGIVRDITLEHEYQQAIEAEKQKYSNIIANMNLGLVEVNNDDEILMANQSFLEMSGYTEDELLGQKGGELLQADLNNDIITIENDKRQKGESNSYELKVKNKAGQIRHWLISGAPNYDLKGNVVGSIGIHLDITELKSLELQKERLLKDLAKSNDELQEYAHIVSHDLKSPLRSIDALVSWLKEDNTENLDEASMNNLNMIQATLEKMEQLINDVLNYSSIASDNTQKQKVNLNLILHDVRDMLFIPNHITLEISDNLPQVYGDPTKLHQLFQNLLSNAIKFNDKEVGRISVDYSDLGSHYQFEVSDNGIGVDPQFHDKIFKIFSALDQRKDSTGVGLSIVKKIVEIHHGKIWLVSIPGTGSTFYFTIKK